MSCRSHWYPPLMSMRKKEFDQTSRRIESDGSICFDSMINFSKIVYYFMIFSTEMKKYIFKKDN